MSKLRDGIQARLDDPIDIALNGDPYVAAIQAVVNLHRPRYAYRHFGDQREVCESCDDGRSVPVWPCPTITLMASAMGIPKSVGADT